MNIQTFVRQNPINFLPYIRGIGQKGIEGSQFYKIQDAFQG